jgi:hypothetical protein
MLMKKTFFFFLFSNARGRLEKFKTFFSCFQVENMVTSMSKISYLYPTHSSKFIVETHIRIF